MSWNYRVIVKHGEYFIKEVYYDDKGIITGFIERPAYPYGLGIMDLKGDLKHMLAAFKHPVIDQRELDCMFGNDKKDEEECEFEIVLEDEFNEEE